MSRKKDGGPAYPTPPDCFGGMSKRELYAMAAMKGLCSNPNVATRFPTNDADIRALEHLAQAAFKVADAMIAEGSK
jgi:hypothetical protein